MKRSKLGFVLGFAVVFTAAFAACGGDDGDEKDTGSSKSGQTTDKDKDNDESMACGSETCKLPKGVTGELCCRDRFTGGCGIKMGASCRPLPKVDERCPVPELNVTIPGMGNIVSQTFGCCTSDNVCGVDFGSGCQPRSVACMVITPDMVDKIKLETCDGEEMPLPANCGMTGFRIPPLPGAAGSGS